ncbi:MAG TPA: hypothetical protein VMH20_00175 [Verrucomicrobiae bacterium]|nr:hypothetical protein [Verrucomicrobiae bacterium]
MLNARGLTLLLASGALLATGGAASAQYAINTVAGGGPNNLAALSSSIGYPAGIARDASENTYVADVNSHRIFLIKGTTGTLTVFAGNGFDIGGEGGYSGDGGPATSAELGRPVGITLDASGDLLIADSNNSRVRCVVGASGGCMGSSLPVGSITTIAGNGTAGYSGDGSAATAAQLNSPSGVAVDSQGDIYIADTDNSVIRCVVGAAGGCLGSAAAVGNITTIAGTGTGGYSGDGAAATAAQLSSPNGLFVDIGGNVFIADTQNSVVRCVVGSTGGCFGSTLVVGSITTVAGTFYDYATGNPPTCQFSGDGGAGTSAYLCLPADVFVDSSGNLFIADTNNFVIREVSGGAIQTIAGVGGSSGDTGDGGAATSATLNYPSTLFVDSSDNVFIGDTNNYVVREVSSGTIQATVGNHTVGYSGDGGAPTNASLYASGGVFIDAKGNLFIADTYNNVIREMAAGTSTIQTVAGTGSACEPPGSTCGDGAVATSAQLNLPSGVYVDSLGDIFIADTENFAIRCVVGTAGGCLGAALAVGDITTIAGTPGTSGSGGDGGAATSSQLDEPTGVYVDSAGNVYIADTDNSKIRCVVGATGGCLGSSLAVGSITTVAGTGAVCQPSGSKCGDGAAAASAQLNFPVGVFGDAAGDLFIADTLDSKIREVAASTGNISTVAGSNSAGYSGDGAAATNAQLSEPYGVFVDSLGNIFIADTLNSAVREVVAVNGNIQTVAGTGTAGYSGDGGGGNLAQLANPLGVAEDATGDIFVADTDNSRVRELTSSVTINIVPTIATLPTGGTQQFAAIVEGTSNTSVTYQVNGVTGGNATVGTITTLGSYQAPSAIPSLATVTVTAVAAANGTTVASSAVTIVSGSSTETVTITTSPTVAVVYTGTTQTFTANVTDSTNAAVTWQVNGIAGGNSSVGTISSPGVYLAPGSVPSPATVVINAVLQANPSVSGSYPVSIVTAPTAPSPASQTATAGGSVTYSLSLNAKTGDSKQVLTLSCLKSSLPQNATCTFNPPTITPGASAVPFSLTINLPVCSAAAQRPQGTFLASSLYVSFLPIAVMLFLGCSGRKNRSRWLTAVILVSAPGLILTGCGGGGSSNSCPNLAGTYNVVVQGTTPAQPNPVTITTVTLIVK